VKVTGATTKLVVEGSTRADLGGAWHLRTLTLTLVYAHLSVMATGIIPVSHHRVSTSRSSFQMDGLLAGLRSSLVYDRST
jgi:hypothetical protein